MKIGQTRGCVTVKTEHSDDMDESVRRAYRHFSTESAPEKLNRAVLREAKSAARQPVISKIFAWSRPLAFAATLLLGVSLVYDMQTVLRETGTPLLPASQTIDSAETVNEEDVAAPAQQADTARTDTDGAERTRDLSGADSAPRARRAAPAGFSAPAATSAAPRPLEKSSALPLNDDATKRVLESEAQVPAKEFRALSREAIAAPASAKQLPASDVASACSDTRYESAEQWWKCVKALDAAGDSATADAELRKLETRYPDFRAPR